MKTSLSLLMIGFFGVAFGQVKNANQTQNQQVKTQKEINPNNKKIRGKVYAAELKDKRKTNTKTLITREISQSKKSTTTKSTATKPE